MTAADVRAQAVRLIPATSIGLAPHDTTLVNIETLMWVDAHQSQALPDVTILGQHVTINIALDHVAWNFGDHQSATETGPGKAYDSAQPCKTRTCPGYFGHVYVNRGTVDVTATASWHATFRVANGPATDIPGTVDGPTAASRITVKEARGILVPDPGNH